MKILLLGGSAREHAIGTAIRRSGEHALFVVAHNDNPGLRKLATRYESHDEADREWIVSLAQECGIDFAVIGLEDALASALPDALRSVDIPTVGPVADAARVETSKLFLRELMQRHGIDGQVEYRVFSSGDELARFLRSTTKEFALKPIGLTAGKGVKVMGVQLASVDDAIAYGREVIRDSVGGDSAIILEEKLCGVEFTLQAFVDGKTVVPMPLVKDYKLAYEGERGPNTGSMGSYSQARGLLDFVSTSAFDSALKIMREIVSALASEGTVYKGVLYGQFMMTPSGPRVIETNARFGDPEAINVLSLLETDFVSICESIVSGKLERLPITFAKSATVCKYITPPGYPDNPRTSRLEIDEAAINRLGVQVFYAKVDERDGGIYTTSSRSIALLGVGKTVEIAEQLVESALPFVKGEYHVRHDIGKGK